MKVINLLVTFALLLISASSAFALDTQPVLSLTIAKKMADACEANQAELGYRKINIAIVDKGAHLILFRRQNDSFLGSIDIAIQKVFFLESSLPELIFIWSQKQVS